MLFKKKSEYSAKKTSCPPCRIYTQVQCAADAASRGLKTIIKEPNERDASSDLSGRIVLDIYVKEFKGFVRHAAIGRKVNNHDKRN